MSYSFRPPGWEEEDEAIGTRMKRIKDRIQRIGRNHCSV
jgi:hypothetical protein